MRWLVSLEEEGNLDTDTHRRRPCAERERATLGEVELGAVQPQGKEHQRFPAAPRSWRTQGLQGIIVVLFEATQCGVFVPAATGDPHTCYQLLGWDRKTGLKCHLGAKRNVHPLARHPASEKLGSATTSFLSFQVVPFISSPREPLALMCGHWSHDPQGWSHSQGTG